MKQSRLGDAGRVQAIASEYLPGEPFEVDVFDWCAEQSKVRDMWAVFGSQAAPDDWRLKIATLKHVNVDIERLRQKWAGFFPRGAYTHFDTKYRGAEQDFGRTPGPAGHLRIGAHTILHFLTLSLFALDGRYLRKCLRPDCLTPYFVADDLRQLYCSNRDCRQWGRVEAKRAWWGRSGRQWRRKHAAEKGS